MPLPDDFSQGGVFAERLVRIYGAEIAASILEELAEDTEDTYWWNPLKSSSYSSNSGAIPGVPLPGMSHVLRIDKSFGLSRHPAVVDGAVYIQNASSVFAAWILGAQPGEEVLDLAAAPGSKTLVLAAAMSNQGRLAAVEPVKARFHRLRANLTRCGVSNVDLYQRDGRGVGRAVPDRFDRVLLDAPCSSESRMRWSQASTYQHWSLRKVKECQRKQRRLLRSAYAALKPGGVLVYSTCSFSPEENELVVDNLLKHTDAQLLPCLPAESLRALSCRTVPGLARWGKRQLSPGLEMSLRILPSSVWDGFYVARLGKPKRVSP